MKNPFKPVTTETSTPLKVLLYGNPGTGKSRAAYTFPSPAVVDAENKSTLHAGVQGISQFAAFPARSLDDLDTAIAYIEEDNGKTYKTLVVDSITILYLQELERVRMASKSKFLGYQERANVNRRMDNTYARLAHLPVNIVVIARESIEYDDEMKAVGIKPDSGGDLGYTFDVVVHMQKDYSGVVERETGQLLTKGHKLVTVNWNAFEDALRNRNKPWYDKQDEITAILDRAKKYFAPITTHTKIREILFDQDMLNIRDWKELGEDRSAALQKIADCLKDAENPAPKTSNSASPSHGEGSGVGNNISPFPDASGLGDGVSTEEAAQAAASFAKTVASAKKKAEAT